MTLGLDAPDALLTAGVAGPGTRRGPGPTPPHGSGLPSLVGMTRAGIRAVLLGIGVPEREAGMRTGQLWHWIYGRGAAEFDSMTTIGKALRTRLAAAATLARPEIVAEQVSRDGTRKWVIRLAPGRAGERPPEIETVYIPESDRGTLCVSSQSAAP